MSIHLDNAFMSMLNEADRRQQNKQIHQPNDAHTAQDDANECKAKNGVENPMKKENFFPLNFNAIVGWCERQMISVHWKNVK